MLSVMRKNAKSWIIKILFGIIVIVFVFFYGFSDVRQGSKNKIVASVGDRKITVGEYMTAYKNMIEFYRAVYKNQFTEEMMQKMGLRQKVLEDLIDREVLLQEAEKLNIQATPEEIRAAIIKTQAFQQNGVFNQRLYERVLSAYGMAAVDYEKDKKKQIILEKMEAVVKNGVKISEKELRDLHLMQNDEVTIAYACFDPQKAEENPAVSEEEIEQYYEKQKEDFRVPDKVKVKYITFRPEDFEQRVTVTAEEIEEYYQTDMEQFFEPRKIKAKHILLKVDKKASPQQEEAVRKKAESLFARLQKGADFSALAKEHSEDAASAENGGDLGYFKKGDMVKPFEEAALSLKPGETGQPVRTQYGYHIIRVDDIREARTRPLEEVTAIIEKELRREKALQQVRKEAKRAFNRLFKSRDIEDYARKIDIKLSETDFFAYGQAPEDAAGKEVFSREAFALDAGELAPAFAVGENYVLMKLVDKRQAHIPAADQVRDAVIRAIRKGKRAQLAKRLAEKALAGLESGSRAWEDLEKDYAVVLKEATFKRMGTYISGLGAAGELKEAAFLLDEQKPLASRVFETDKGTVLVKLKKKQSPDEDGFAKARENLAVNTVRTKQQEAFSLYLQKLKSKTEIWVDSKLLPAA